MKHGFLEEGDMKVRALTILLFGMGLCSSTLFGQAIGSITGVVQDPTAARIPGVSVSATNNATGVKSSTVTNESGAYNFSNLSVGPYRLDASLPGFRTARVAVSYTHLRAHETPEHLVCRLLLEK